MKLWLLLIAGLLAGCTTGGRSANSAWRSVDYAEDTTNFANPERGFSLPDYKLAQVRQSGMTLAHAYFRLDAFRDGPISQAYLDQLQRPFDAARDAGVKLVPRFAYNFPAGLPLKAGDEDAPLAVVLGHIDQIAPLLQRNSDVIAYLEAGFVGAWGEWHNSTNGLDRPEAEAAILKRLLRALPRDRFVALRYQRDKAAIFGREGAPPLDEILAATDSGRIGHHNDCFLAAPEDWGTYRPGDEASVAAQKAALAAENQHVPQGGETCNIGPEAQPFVHCANALPELERLHWSQLNAAYHPKVMELWRTEGCYDEIAKRLGYRLRLMRGSFAETVARGGRLTGTLTLANDGFAAPYNRRPAALVLKNGASGVIVELPLDGVDPRTWTSGAVHQVPISVVLPAGLDPGEYDMFLNLPDPNRGLRTRPAFAIRLANIGTWDPATGYNRLLTTVRVI